jgi:predicted RNase H-like nuclease (RuvC/YqgF family)
MNGGGGGGATPPAAYLSGGAPSIHTVDVDENDDDFPTRDSPQRTVADLMSVSTAGAGPSVQLVERMSATVRRLEMEKSASRDEIARLQGQRDEARDEVVSLMREMESFKGDHDKIAKLEADMVEVQKRYDAALEMLGEKSEECEELKNDVIDLKKIYRELVETMR